MKSKLKLFEIKNLFNQFDVTLPLDQEINIFLGENGMGKTTILNCLYYTLSGNMEKLKNIFFETISITFADGEKYSVNYNDIVAYVEEYMYDAPAYRRRRVHLDNILSPKDLENFYSLFMNEQDYESEEVRKNIFKVADFYGLTYVAAKRELERYIALNIMSEGKKADYKKVINFKSKIEEKIEEEIIYFPTYRRIEEDISRLGIDVEKDKVKSKLIQFGMTDVERSTAEFLRKIKNISINGFTKMTGVLLKQYLYGDFSELDEYKVEKNKLFIALARIGDQIESEDKQKIIELVDNAEIYNLENRYLLNLIRNLIDSYERQNSYDEQIKSFVSTCNKYLNGKKYIYDESNVELAIYKEGKKRNISVQNLSSGEKQIISVFFKLYIEKNEKCIILFDEPELSLSIMWQNMFLPDVVKSGKCSTLIAVTHSPFIFENEFDEFARDMGNCLLERV